MITGKLEHANSIGMALTSVLSIQLSIEPEREDLKELCNCLYYHSELVSSSDPTFLANGDQILPILKINCFLIMAVSLGLRINDAHGLYAPSKKCAIPLLPP